MADRAGNHVALVITRRDATLGLLALVLASCAPRNACLPKVCVFNSLTGLPCPFCGLTRSFVALGHGDLAAGSREHLLGAPAYALAWVAVIRALRAGTLRLELTPRTVTGLVVLVLGAWLVRLFQHRY